MHSMNLGETGPADNSTTQQTFCGVPAVVPALASVGAAAGTPQNVCWGVSIRNLGVEFYAPMSMDRLVSNVCKLANNQIRMISWKRRMLGRKTSVRLSMHSSKS